MKGVRQLGNRAYITITCPHCGYSGDYRREGVRSGHSYLEGIYGEIYTCDHCDQPMEVNNNFLYGFVRN